MYCECTVEFGLIEETIFNQLQMSGHYMKCAYWSVSVWTNRRLVRITKLISVIYFCKGGVSVVTFVSNVEAFGSSTCGFFFAPFQATRQRGRGGMMNFIKKILIGIVEYSFFLALLIAVAAGIVREFSPIGSSHQKTVQTVASPVARRSVN